MMNIIICDDEIYYQQAIVNSVEAWIAKTGHNNIRYSCYSSSEDLLERWEKGLHIDLLFLDIQIPNELSGMTLAQRVRNLDPNISIVFITNYSNYVYEGYTVNALRYLRKPVHEHDVFSCLEIAYRHYELLKCDSIVIESRDQCFVLRYSDILYIESRSHYLSFCLNDVNVCPEIRKKLSEISAHLPSELFVQCHRSYIVNLSHIRRFTKCSVIMSNGQSLPVSSTYFSSLSMAFSYYYREEKV